MQRIERKRSVVAGVVALGALVLAACAPPVAPQRQLVDAQLDRGRVADESDVAYGPDEDHELDVYLTDSTTRRGTIVFVHGGGWTSGDKETLVAGTFGPVLAQLARGFDIVSIDYRLAPEHPFPAALDDVGLAVSWVLADGADHGLDTSRVVLLGHSAGGSLTAMVGTSPGLRTEFGRLPRVDRWVAISAMSSYGPEGLLDDFPANWGLSSPGARWMASPINTLDRTDPPGYLVHGDRDGFVADWHSVLMAERARAVGARVGFDHITSGPPECRGHFGPCGADLTPLELFLG